MSHTRHQLGLLALCTAGVWMAGCGEEGTPVPNIEPETAITGSVPVEGGSTAHHVQFFWNGSDIDGAVDRYEYLLQTYPRSVVDFSNIRVAPPAADDPRWTVTGAHSTTLIVAADTLRADPRGDIGDGRFERWHTFWVRAIDNEGGVDQTPAARTFEAFTKAPEMTLVTPVVLGQVPVLPSSFVMNWYGSDDIGVTGDYQDPLEVRWVLKIVTLDAGGVPVGFPDILFDLDESEWSDWFSWDAADSTGREAVFLDQLPGGVVDTAYLFALQGRDDAGAITPQFDLDTPLANNAGVFMLSHSIPVGPTLTVHATLDTLMVGDWDFVGSSATTQTVLVPAGAISVNWDVMKTSHYGANPGDYRYGWNIADPANDALWSDWGTARISPPQNLLLPIEELRIQARDNIGQVTNAVIRFQKM